MSSRIKSREIAVELSYQMMINKDSVEETIENFKENMDDGLNECDFTYITRVLGGVKENEKDIDAIIEKSLVNWKIERISKVNLAILRVAVFEINYLDEVPDRVAINEALEITKKYSDEKSVSFVNAVLDNVVKNK